MRNSILFLISFLISLLTFSQNSNQLLGTWKLEKISYKKIAATNDGEEQFRSVFNAALYNQLNAEQQLDVYELDQLNTQAEELLKLFYQSTEQVFWSKLYLENIYWMVKNSIWKTSDKNEMKILKITVDELVFKDSELGVAYYYLK